MEDIALAIIFAAFCWAVVQVLKIIAKSERDKEQDDDE